MLLKSEEIKTIFQENYTGLCRFLESIVGRDRQAQDLAQESFLRLCGAQFNEISLDEIRFWLFRVARNLALNEVDKTARQVNKWHQVRDFFKKSEPQPDDILVHGENQKIVRELINHLPEYQRSALLLREQEDMSYREIALILNISESKVKIDIFRARQTLRALWYERHDKQL